MYVHRPYVCIAGHRAKKKDWAENDYYDSDEDTFLDRTGISKKLQYVDAIGMVKWSVACTGESFPLTIWLSHLGQANVINFFSVVQLKGNARTA